MEDNAAHDEPIILYTANWCGLARSVETYLQQYEIPLRVIDIDSDPEARQELVKLNNGYASVPTLIFPDGTKMTEPPISKIRDKLGLQTESWMDQVRHLFSSHR